MSLGDGRGFVVFPDGGVFDFDFEFPVFFEEELGVGK